MGCDKCMDASAGNGYFWCLRITSNALCDCHKKEGYVKKIICIVNHQPTVVFVR